MGAKFDFIFEKEGYYPRGGGIVKLVAESVIMNKY